MHDQFGSRGRGVYEHGRDGDDRHHHGQLGGSGLQEAPLLEHGGDLPSQSRDRVAVVVRAEREQRDDERDLGEEQEAVLRLPEPTPASDLHVAVHRPGQNQDDDRDDRHPREARNAPRRERPAVIPRQGQRKYDERKPAGPGSRRLHVGNVGQERQRPGDARVAREGGRDHERRDENQGQAEKRLVSPSRPTSQSERRQRHLGPEHRAEKGELPVARLGDRGDDVPAERFEQAEAARGRPLEDDPEECEDREHAAERRENPEELGQEGGSGRAEREHEGCQAARAEKKQGELEEATARVEERDDERRSLVHLRGDAGRLRAAGADVEDEGAADRIRVGRDHPPGNRVGALLERPLDGDGNLPRRPARDSLGVHALAGGVEDADGAQRGLHRLVEAQEHAARRLLDDGVLRRLGGDEHRVRGGGRHCHERSESGRYGDRPPPPRSVVTRADHLRLLLWSGAHTAVDVSPDR